VDDKAEKCRCSPTTASFSNAGIRVKVRSINAENPRAAGIDVLIALLDAAHLHHTKARAWLEANIELGWVPSPLTQNGCIRILSQPTYPGSQPPAAIAAPTLRFRFSKS